MKSQEPSSAHNNKGVRIITHSDKNSVVLRTEQGARLTIVSPYNNVLVKNLLNNLRSNVLRMLVSCRWNDCKDCTALYHETIEHDRSNDILASY